MRFLETQDSVISHYPIMFYLFSAICLASSVQTELLSLPGCPSKCGNLTIPFPFGMSSECSFDHSFHITCDSSFEPPKPFLRLLNAEVVSISLDGKVELLNSSTSLLGLEDREGEILHMVVDWAAGDEVCHVAQRYGSRYACQSPHSQCMDSSTGQGHICRCLPGYQGNPYLAHGCRDVDECAVSNPCEGACENLPGSFKCHCAKGSVGDGGKDGKGCRHTEYQIINWSASLVVILPIGIFFIAPILAITFGENVDEVAIKLRKKESRNFKINGGNLLEMKRKKKKLELDIYSTQEINTISNFLPEINMITCNQGVKFYRGTLPPTASTSTGASTSTNNDVVVQTIGGLPEDKREDFVNELIFLSEPRANLVRVLGCCLVQREPTIVYERCGDENTTLFDCTSSISDLAANFSCEMRIEAAKGVARGLEHFYKFKFKPTYVRGDISSANIMMDTTSYEPKIFYAAGSNLIPPASASASPPAPVAKDLKEKMDVSIFGTILVELLTGGRTVVTDLSNSIRMAQAHGLFEILDDEMKGKGMAVSKIATVADKCLNVIPEQIPTMKEVLDELLDRPTEQPALFSRLFHCSTVR